MKRKSFIRTHLTGNDSLSNTDDLHAVSFCLRLVVPATVHPVVDEDGVEDQSQNSHHDFSHADSVEKYFHLSLPGSLLLSHQSYREDVIFVSLEVFLSVLNFAVHCLNAVSDNFFQFLLQCNPVHTEGLEEM